jgi:methionyl-tRNA formyltransferase
MNILFAGTPENSSQVLRSLINMENIAVKGVITQPDKRGKRGSKLNESSVSKVAKESSIPVFKENNLNSKEFKDNISKLDIDLLLVVAFGKIIPGWLLSKPNLMPINIHFSLLPKYRGASPVQSSLINGDSETGITFIKMSASLDAGQTIASFKCNILENDNKISLEKKLTEISIEKLNEILINIESNNISLLFQDEGAASYCKKINKSDGLINFDQSSKLIYDTFRAYKEWPETTFEYKNKLIKIHDLHISNKQSEGDPGTVAIFDKSGIYLNTVDLMIVVTHLQFASKKSISSNDAFNSYKDFFS